MDALEKEVACGERESQLCPLEKCCSSRGRSLPPESGQEAQAG